MSKSAEKKPVVDWERVESDYRAGLLSVREIAAAHGISHTYINRKVKEKGWTRDLSQRIQDKAESLVSESIVSSVVSSAARLETDEAIVDANAKLVASVKITQRKDISKFRAIALQLLEELQAQTNDNGLFEDLGVLLRQDDEKGQDKRNDLYNKVISSAGRIDSVKKLAEVLKILIGLEREAYGIVDQPAKGESNENLANALEAARARLRAA